MRGWSARTSRGRIVRRGGDDAVSYWWRGDRSERFWIEIRWVDGIGRALVCPAPPRDGSPHNPWYQLVGQVERGDVVYHWSAVEHRFVGRSEVARPVRQVGGDWVVDLRGFMPLVATVDLATVRRLEPELVAIRDQLGAKHGHPLYLPFQFRRDGLRLMSNYFAKVPAAAVEVLFDATQLGEASADDPPAEEGPPAAVESTGASSSKFLSPFKAKADTDYVTRIRGGVQRRGRKHETLVNSFAAWLDAKGLDAGRNAAIDLGLSNPPVVIEAKIVTHWANAIRAAVGQLYEYRYFKVADPKAALIVLASQPVPGAWLRYLEHDRKIGAAWPEGDGFVLSPVARRALRVKWHRSGGRNRSARSLG